MVLLPDWRPHELCNLDPLMVGDYTVEERMMLEVSFYQNGQKQTYQVLNEAVIARGALSQILDLTVCFRREPFPRGLSS